MMERRTGMNGTEWFYTDDTYTTLVEKRAEILAHEYLGSYQGDVVFLVDGAEGFGLLVIGYGSCSGCDALEACESQEQVDKIGESILEGIKWFDTLQEAKDYILNNDIQELKWYAHDAAWASFIDKVKEL